MVRARKGEPGKTLLHQLPTAPPMRPRDVVQELRLHVSGKELAVRLGERIRWHRQRGDDLIEQMKKLAEVEREATEELARALAAYDSPRMRIEKQLREHQERAAFLAFFFAITCQPTTSTGWTHPT
jgi:hypothetical protein